MVAEGIKIMKWRTRKPGVRYRAKHHWHKWFAWHPVTVPTHGRMSNMTSVWFETIERKGKVCEHWDGSFWIWEYRFISTNHKE